jgi:hypothetical protein
VCNLLKLSIDFQLVSMTIGLLVKGMMSTSHMDNRALLCRRITVIGETHNQIVKNEVQLLIAQLIRLTDVT